MSSRCEISNICKKDFLLKMDICGIRLTPKTMSFGFRSSIHRALTASMTFPSFAQTPLRIHQLIHHSPIAMPPIKQIEYFRVKPRWLFVKLTDAEDKVGWGEATLEGHSLAVEGALDEMITTIMGFEAE